MLPHISPSSLTSLKEPCHPDWIYELKHDCFRGISYVDREQAWLVSRKGKKFHQFDPLLKQVLRCLKGSASFWMVRLWCWMRKAARTSLISWAARATLAPDRTPRLSATQHDGKEGASQHADAHVDMSALWLR
jgi:hypothetical protein